MDAIQRHYVEELGYALEALRLAEADLARLTPAGAAGKLGHWTTPSRHWLRAEIAGVEAMQLLVPDDTARSST